MAISQRIRTQGVPDSFIDLTGTELRRAERYRTFLSLGILELGFDSERPTESECADLTDHLCDRIQQGVRGCDKVSAIDNCRLCLLLPETSRQGAEAALKRIISEIGRELSQLFNDGNRPTLSVELASYPDAAGARTIRQVLEGLERQNQN